MNKQTNKKTKGQGPKVSKVINQTYEGVIFGQLVVTCIQQDDEGSINKFVQRIDCNGEEFNIIAGTALNALFEFNRALKSCNDKGAFKATIPTRVIVDNGANLWDTECLPLSTQSALKFGNTSKSMRRFGRKFYTMLKFVNTSPRVVSYEVLDEELKQD